MERNCAPRPLTAPLDLAAGGALSLAAAAADADVASARRIPLDATPWIDHVPGWRSGSVALFVAQVTAQFIALLRAALWEQRDRWIADGHRREPRLTATYPDLATAP